MESKSSTAKKIFFREKKSIKVKNNQWKVNPWKVNRVYVLFHPIGSLNQAEISASVAATDECSLIISQQLVIIIPTRICIISIHLQCEFLTYIYLYFQYKYIQILI